MNMFTCTNVFRTIGSVPVKFSSIYNPASPDQRFLVPCIIILVGSIVDLLIRFPAACMFICSMPIFIEINIDCL